MKNVAKLDENNVVIAINIQLDDYELQDSEAVVTNPAYVGGDYFEGYFYPPKPFTSWSRGSAGEWEAPIAYPTDGLMYSWNEELGDWEAVVFESTTDEQGEVEA